MKSPRRSTLGVGRSARMEYKASLNQDNNRNNNNQKKKKKKKKKKALNKNKRKNNKGGGCNIGDRELSSCWSLHLCTHEIQSNDLQVVSPSWAGSASLSYKHISVWVQWLCSQRDKYPNYILHNYVKRPKERILCWVELFSTWDEIACPALHAHLHFPPDPVVIQKSIRR